MAKEPASTSSCRCNQVVFDLTNKKPGKEIKCPWCKRRYVLNDDHLLQELPRLGGKAPAKSDDGKSGAKEKTSDKKKQAKREPERQDKKETKEKGASKSDRQGRPAKKKEAGDEKTDRSSRRRTRRETAPDAGKKKPDKNESKKKDNKETGDTGKVEVDEIATEDLLSDLDSMFESSDDKDAVSDSDDSSDAAFAAGVMDSVDAKIPASASTRGRPGRPRDVEPAEPPPLNLERLVFYMFCAAVPVGAIAYAVYMWWGVSEGIYQFQTYKILGITVEGNNPWVWVGGILLGALLFFGAWVAYTYLFVYLRGKNSKGDEGSGRESMRKMRARASTRTTRREN